MWLTLSISLISSAAVLHGCIPTVSQDDLPDSITTITTIPSTSPTSSTATTTSIATTTTTSAACLPGWVYFAFTNYCYLAVNLGAPGITQPNAEVQCQSYGGHLASIHSVEENDFIFSLYTPGPSSALILGLYRTGSSPTDFANYDGTPVDYTNWANHNIMQPDNFNNNEYCAAMFLLPSIPAPGNILGLPKEWNDYTCSSLGQFYTCKLPRL